MSVGEVVWRWQRNRTGRPLSPPQIQKIKRSFECWAASTKQLLNTGEGHQAPRKVAHSLQKEVGQNIKDKKRDKRVRDGDYPGKGVLKEEMFPNTRKHSHRRVCGEFWNLRGQHNWEEKKKKKPTEYVPNCNSQQRSSPEVAQMWICHQRAGAEQGGVGGIENWAWMPWGQSEGANVRQ